MDVVKFESMLKNQGLYFCRADLLGDSFEGSYPAGNIAKRTRQEYPDVSQVRLARFTSFRNSSFRQLIFVNCWHLSEHESLAMWSLYKGSGKTIAIKTTYSKLRDALDEGCYIGQIKYIDYRASTIVDSNILSPLMHKRVELDHESEVRAVFGGISTNNGGDTRSVSQAKGVWKHVDLDKLLDSIVVGPGSGADFLGKVAEMAKQYSIRASVIPSALDDKPAF